NYSGSTYFIDQDENKGREIDARAYKNANDTQSSPVIFCWSLLSVEVKKSDKPWVIFTSPRAKFGESGGHNVTSYKNNTGKVFDRGIFEKYHPTYKLPRVGRTSQVAFSHDTATIFSALVGATKATIDEYRAAEEHKEFWSDDSIDVVDYEPLVVVNGPLIECYLDDNDELVSQQVEHLQFALHYASPNYKAEQYMVDIVTLSSLNDYLSKREKCLDMCLQNMSSKSSA
ncbi:hypothetical protein V9N52_004304, partial [Vibrio navarrensis]